MQKHRKAAQHLLCQTASLYRLVRTHFMHSTFLSSDNLLYLSSALIVCLRTQYKKDFSCMPVVLIHPRHGFQRFFWGYSRNCRLLFLFLCRLQCLLKTSTATLGITVIIADPRYMSYRIYFFNSDWVIDCCVCFNLLLELISANTYYNVTC